MPKIERYGNITCYSISEEESKRIKLKRDLEYFQYLYKRKPKNKQEFIKFIKYLDKKEELNKQKYKESYDYVYNSVHNPHIDIYTNYGKREKCPDLNYYDYDIFYSNKKY